MIWRIGLTTMTEYWVGDGLNDAQILTLFAISLTVGVYVFQQFYEPYLEDRINCVRKIEYGMVLFCLILLTMKDTDYALTPQKFSDTLIIANIFMWLLLSWHATFLAIEIHRFVIKNSRKAENEDKEEYKDKAKKIEKPFQPLLQSYRLLVLLLPYVTYYLSKGLSCIDFEALGEEGGGIFLAADMSINCDDDDYKLKRLFIIFAILLIYFSETNVI